ncbi:MAG: hypothetical protein F4X56_10695 [Gammaproteobacteria bacterium]|nr:hypothetical protein [Gammaproteobacteria bacterium]
MAIDEAAVGRLFIRHREAKTNLVCLRSDLKAKGEQLVNLGRRLTGDGLVGIEIVGSNIQQVGDAVNAPVELLPFNFLEEIAGDVQQVRDLEQKVADLEKCLEAARLG